MKFFPFSYYFFLHRMVDIEEVDLGYRDDADAWLSGVADFPRVGGFQQDDWLFQMGRVVIDLNMLDIPVLTSDMGK